ncbi:hypothetical protein CALVIDRAFT_560084 [Calocera viscosa TUFC12733]|uniref:Uncharacterized protein n=1 Tax=Calocera viscosa (strain TUFC12733) TaxID=1330018 RepID=A0A167RBU5_CALVF|nr:hypothetical protein CALVIDRAFT_560084 [Calocera viscosa TUFC12733]
MASYNARYEGDPRYPQPTPYQSSTHLVDYPLGDDPDRKVYALDDDYDEMDNHQHPYNPNTHIPSAQVTYDAALPPGYPPMRKSSKASSIDVSDIIDSYDDHEMSSPPQDHKPDLVDTPPPAPPTRRAFFRSFFPSSLACRLYLLVALLETFVDVAIEVELFLRVRNASKASGSDSQVDGNRLPIYIFLFGLAHAYQFVLAVDAVRSRNMLQILFLAIFNALMILYSVLQISEVQSALPAGTSGIVSIPINIVLLLVPIVIAVAEVAYLLLSWKIHTEFGWDNYKALGADRRIKKIFLHFQVFECLLKFDVYFWIGFSVQFIFLALDDSDIEFPLTIAALPISLLLLVEGHLAARFENRWLMASFMVGTLAACVYFAYKLVRILMERSEPSFMSVWKSLVGFSSACIALIILTFVMACIVFYNFGKGLKRHMQKGKRTLDAPSSRRVDGNPNFRNPNRMSIE